MLMDGFKIHSITFGLETSNEDRKSIMKKIKNCEFYQMIYVDKIHKPFEIIKTKLE